VGVKADEECGTVHNREKGGIMVEVGDRVQLKGKIWRVNVREAYGTVQEVYGAEMLVKLDGLDTPLIVSRGEWRYAKK